MGRSEVTGKHWFYRMLLPGVSDAAPECEATKIDIARRIRNGTDKSGGIFDACFRQKDEA